MFRDGTGREGLSEGSSRRSGKAVGGGGGEREDYLISFSLFFTSAPLAGRTRPGAEARRRTPKGDIVLAIYTSRTHARARARISSRARVYANVTCSSLFSWVVAITVGVCVCELVWTRVGGGRSEGTGRRKGLPHMRAGTVPVAAAVAPAPRVPGQVFRAGNAAAGRLRIRRRPIRFDTGRRQRSETRASGQRVRLATGGDPPPSEGETDPGPSDRVLPETCARSSAGLVVGSFEGIEKSVHTDTSHFAYRTATVVPAPRVSGHNAAHDRFAMGMRRASTGSRAHVVFPRTAYARYLSPSTHSFHIRSVRETNRNGLRSIYTHDRAGEIYNILRGK